MLRSRSTNPRSGDRAGSVRTSEDRRAARLAAMVRYARQHSPFYRRHYAGLPDTVTDSTLLPATDKRMLMDRFDDWVADPDVTLERVREFIADPERVGEPFLGRYLVCTTSGTTGSPGVFVMDPRALRINLAVSLRMRLSWIGAGGLARLTAAGGRTAAVVATGGHYAVAAGLGRQMRSATGRRTLRVFSVHDDITALVRQLQEFRPAMLLGYGSVIDLLAREQRAGRLRITPVLVEPAGETLSETARARIADAFGCQVRSGYGSTECTFLANGCSAGWYHVTHEWGVLEPVDAEHRPVPPGEYSDTVLISNLANRIQPILRYELGDSVLRRPDPCPCGNPAPAYHVQGRRSQLLRFETARGSVSIPPLAFATLLDRIPGVAAFQLVQTTPSTLRVRLRSTDDADSELVWGAVRRSVSSMLSERGVAEVVVERAAEAPRQEPGGKFRSVIPFHPPTE